MRVLLIVHSCDAHDIGEAYTGYLMASGIAERCDTTILTMRKHGAGLVAPQIPHAEVIECAEPPIRRFAERIAAIIKPGYLRFYAFARAQMLRLLRTRRFDLIHEFTPFAPRYPHVTAAAPRDVPVVLGPFAGTLGVPPGFEKEIEGEPWYMKFRTLDHTRLALDPFLRRGFQRANIVLGAAPYIFERSLSFVSDKRRGYLLETPYSNLPPLTRSNKGGGPMKIAFVGRLVRTKGCHFLIRAMVKVAKSEATLTVVGDGPEKEHLREEAERLGVADRVEFTGRVPRDRAMKLLAGSDLFVFPSFREPVGHVVIEAMAAGVPVVALRYGGPAAIASDDAAVLVDPGDPNSLPDRLAAQIRSLAEDTERRESIGMAGRVYAEKNHTWGPKLDDLLALYERLCKSVEPDFDAD